MTADLEVLVQIQSRKPTLDWHDDDALMVHSAVNMLKNEIAVLQYNKQAAERPAPKDTVGATLRAALVSAGQRAIKSVMLVGQLPSARSSQCLGDMCDDKDEVGSGLEHRLVRFSSSSESYIDEAHPMLERCCSEPMPRASFQARAGRRIVPYRKDPASTDNDDLEVFIISVGGKLLPLSGTW